MHIAKRLEPLLRRLALRTVPRRGNRIVVPLDPTNLSRVLVYRPQRFGDLFATLPILRALREAFPSWHLALWTSAQGKALVQPEVVVDDIRICSGRAGDLLSHGRDTEFDLVMDLVPHDSVNALRACRRAARRGILAGFGKDAFCSYYDWARPYPSPDFYAPRAGLGILELLGLSPERVEFGLHYLDSEQAFATRMLGASAGAVMLNLSARHAWPEGAWGQLCSHLVERFDAPILINALGDDRHVASNLAKARPDRVRVLPEHTTFREVACLVSQALLFVSPDTSLVHVAAAAGVPTVGLYPMRHDSRLSWIPPGENVRVVRATSPNTLADVPALVVYSSVEALVGARRAGRVL